MFPPTAPPSSPRYLIRLLSDGHVLETLQRSRSLFPEAKQVRRGHGTAWPACYSQQALDLDSFHWILELVT